MLVSGSECGCYGAPFKEGRVFIRTYLSDWLEVTVQHATSNLKDADWKMMAWLNFMMNDQSESNLS